MVRSLLVLRDRTGRNGSRERVAFVIFLFVPGCRSEVGRGRRWPVIDELVLMIGLFDDHHGVLDVGVGEIAAQRRLSVRRLVARRRRQAARLALDLFEQLRIAC